MAHASVSSMSTGILIAKQAFATRYSANVPSCGCLTFLSTAHIHQRASTFQEELRFDARSIADSTNSVSYFQILFYARADLEDHSRIV